MPIIVPPNKSISVDSLAYYGLIINGGFDVSQAASNNQVSFANSYGYTADQWTANVHSAQMTFQQVASPFINYPWCAHGMKANVFNSKAVLQSSDYVTLSQPIEGKRFKKLGFGTSNAISVITGFIAKSSIAMTAYVSLQNYNKTRSYAQAFTLAANTETFVCMAFPADTSGSWFNTETTTAATLNFTYGCGSSLTGTTGSWQGSNVLGGADITNFPVANNNNIIISSVVMLPGITDTTLLTSSNIQKVQRHPDDELRYCQRYYETSYDYTQGYFPGSVSIYSSFIKNVEATTSNASIHIPFKVTKAIFPATTLYSPSSGSAASIYVVGSGDVAGAKNYMDVNGFMAYVNNVSVTSGSTIEVHWIADARL